MSPNLAIIFLPKKFNEVQLMEWIRAKNIPNTYGIGKSTAYALLKEFMAQADKEDYIRDGRITIVRKEVFEEWWMQKGRSRDEK